MTRSFDTIYADVPYDQREALRFFRLSHPERRLDVQGTEWRYLIGGEDGPALLLLVGGLRMADAAFRNIPLLEDRFRVIAPSYPPLHRMADLADGIAAILDHEGISQVHVLAGSFGGMLAQVFLRRHMQRVDRAVLSTTAVFDEDTSSRYRQALAMVEATEESAVLSFAKQQMFDIIAPPEDMHAFYRAYIDELYSQRVNKAGIVSTYRALLDFADNVTLHPDDLADWPGQLLILESDDDATFDEPTRERVRGLYPQAQHYVFQNAGHSPATTQRELYFRVVREFLLGL